MATQYRSLGRRVPASISEDLNIIVGGFLQDLALVQGSERSRFGYKRAARALVTGTDRSVRELVQEGILRDVPFVGPSTERVVLEVLRTGTSASVQQSVEASVRRAEVHRRREWRRAYLSRHAMRLALDSRLAREIVSPAWYLGDLQMHSTWSDGLESIADLADAALALGWSRIGVTDHSYGLPIARGMSMDAARRQHDEIDGVNERVAGRLRVYKGIEANILADGSLDLQEDERRAFDYVIAAPHSALRREADQTARLLAAVREPGVAMLGHPQGRMYNNRPGISADWRKVFREAASRQVAVELDGNWHRQDVDYELAIVALEAGCLFALDSDAHSIGELPFTDYAIAHARIAQIPSERVVNCWSKQKFEDWLGSRRRRKSRRGSARTPPRHDPDSSAGSRRRR